MKRLFLITLFCNLAIAQGNYTPEIMAEHLANEEYVQALYVARATYGIKSQEQIPILDKLIESSDEPITYLFTKYNITKETSLLRIIAEEYITQSKESNSIYPINRAKSLYTGMDTIEGYLGMAFCLAEELEFYNNQTLNYFRESALLQSSSSFINLVSLQSEKDRKMFSTFLLFKRYLKRSAEVMEPEYVVEYNQLHDKMQGILAQIQ